MDAPRHRSRAGANSSQPSRPCACLLPVSGVLRSDPYSVFGAVQGGAGLHAGMVWLLVITVGAMT